MAGGPQYVIQIMATQTRFDLNAAVENWRNELAAQPQLTSDDRRELEKHLADSMADLRGRGLNEEESFWLGRRRIGQPQQLAEEFEKANPGEIWRERAFWMIAAVMAFWIWLQISTPFFNMLSDYLHSNFGLPPFWEIFVINLPFVLAIYLISTGRIAWLAHRFSAVVHSQVRLAFAAVLLVIFSSFLAGLAEWLRQANFRMRDDLVQLTSQNMVAPLVFIPLLILLMPKKPKKSKRA